MEVFQIIIQISLSNTKKMKFILLKHEGREDVDDILKINRLVQWCEDINKIESNTRYYWLYVKEEDYEKYKVKSFVELISLNK